MSTLHTGFLHIAGEDAKKLLQGQLTCNMDEITPENSSLAAHCNPQGRIISLFQIYLYQNQYYLKMPKEMVPIALAALKKYAVFFKVTLIETDDTPFLQNISSTEEEQLIDNIIAGIPAIYPETSEKFLPHELNLHTLNAISFNKGCYTGQEIIARMHYRGKLKTHMYRAQVQSTIPPIRYSPIYDTDSHSRGTIVDYAAIGYNNYMLLVVATETDITTLSLYLDTQQQAQLEFL